MNLTNEKLNEMYRMMVLIRKFETSLHEAVASGTLPGFVHLGVGQEAVMVGIAAGLEPDDWVASSHREHGLLLARGADVGRARAEIYGKATGYCKGKGGSMHLAALDKHCTGCNGILGASQVIVNGLAFALKYNKTKNVAAVVFGDGSAERGEFHEGMNLASVWKLPTLFLCVNNGYGISVSTKFSAAVEDIAARGVAYGVPGLVVDGNDPIAVYEAVSEAAKRARSGAGPSLVELKTARQFGHFEGDPQVYKTAEEKEETLRNDPIPRFEKTLLDKKILTKEKVAELRASAEADLQAAIKFTDESPYPSFEEAFTDLFYTEVPA
jgi:acetoin:2,6-dichlorophenolindophenol oxidoreductase subunit alpha